MEDYSGKLLIASPHLRDPNFLQSVVYLVRHSQEGALGVVLNRPLGIPFDEQLAEVLSWTPQRPIELGWGGPVEGALLALHDQKDLAEIPCDMGLYFAGSETAIRELAERPMAQVRLFMGYSGWGAEQLEREVQVGGWLLGDGNAEEVFGETESLWRRCVSRVGRDILSTGLGEGWQGAEPGLN